MSSIMDILGPLLAGGQNQQMPGSMQTPAWNPNLPDPRQQTNTIPQAGSGGVVQPRPNQPNPKGMAAIFQNPQMLAGIAQILMGAIGGKGGGYMGQGMQQAMTAQQELQQRQQQLASEDAYRKAQIANERRGQDIQAGIQGANQGRQSATERRQAIKDASDYAEKNGVNIEDALPLFLPSDAPATPAELKNAAVIQGQINKRIADQKALADQEMVYVDRKTGEIADAAGPNTIRMKAGDAALFRQRLNPEKTPVSYQDIEISDPKAPGGHRTAFFNPKTRQIEDAAGNAIPNAQRYFQSAGSQVPPEVDEAMNAAAEALASKDPARLLSLKDVTSLRSGQNQRLIVFARAEKIARARGEHFSTAEADRMIKMLDWTYNGVGANQLQSYGTFLEHAGAVSDALKSVNLTDMKVLNKPWNTIKQEATKNPELARLVVAVEPVRKEFESFLLNNRALYEDDRQSALDMVNVNQAPAVLMASLNQMGHTAQARTNEINGRFKKVIHSDIPFEDLYTPEAIEAARKIGIDLTRAGTVPVKTGAAKTPTNVPDLSKYVIKK